jgi:hypothetical protein
MRAMSAIISNEMLVDAIGDYEGEDSRYAIYAVSTAKARIGGPPRRRIAETSLDGIGLCLSTLRAENEITDDSRVGIFDRLDRIWVVNPWARGDL